MKTRFFFDIESQSLHGEGFAYGYVVINENQETKEFKILEKGECYSILGAKEANKWVKENVIPSLTLLTPYLEKNLSTFDITSLPSEIVISNKELRDKFYSIYSKWKKQGVEFWSDVNFPVETNFLSAIVKDGNGSRDWDMPYPLLDVSNFVNVNINRNEYSELSGLRKHNPLDDALASAYSLNKYELELSIKNRLKSDLKEISQKSNDSANSVVTIIKNTGSPIHKSL